MEVSQRSGPARRMAWPRWCTPPRVEFVVVTLVLLAFVRVHSALLLTGFGEADGARMALEAAMAHYHLASNDTRYSQTQVRTSPLYVRSLQRVMDLGVPMSEVPRLMNWFSLASCAIALGAVYLLFRSLTDRLTAALAATLFALTPAFWMAANYGMAHTPALAALLLALLSFSHALTDDAAPRRAWTWLALSLVLMTIALCFKADYFLTGLAFPVLAWMRRKPRRFVVYGGAIVAIALAIEILYAKTAMHSVEATSASLGEFAQHWHEKFPFTTKTWFNKFEYGAITHSSGIFLFAIAVFALAAHLASRAGSRLGVWAAAWSLPVVVFWGSTLGNSARHNLSALAPLMLLVVSLVTRITETRVRATVLVALIAGANYVSDREGSTRGASGVLPKSNVIQLSLDQESYSADMMDWTKMFAALDEEKKALISVDLTAAAQFAVLARAEGKFKVEERDDALVLLRGPDEVQRVRFVYCSHSDDSHAIRRDLQKEGYTVRIRHCGR